MNLTTWANLSHKKILVRIDGNVPIKDAIITNDFRLRAVIPTLQFLQKCGGKITIITHMGRPKDRETQLSTKPLQQWFDHQHIQVTVLENLRFDPREKLGDPAYAQKLAHGFDYFVQDAWGALHRHDTSITLLPQCFAPEKRTVGLLVEKELAALAQLKNNPKKPYLLFLGGGKGETKLKILEKLICTKKPSTIFVLPALCFTFFKAMGKQIGKSLIDNDFLPHALQILKNAQTNNIELLFPLDVTYLEEKSQGNLQCCDIDHFPDTGIGMGIGQKSLTLYAEKIAAAKTIFFNGAMGIDSRPESQLSTIQLLKLIARAAQAYRVVGGGDSIAAAEDAALFNQFNFCSTGGGSTLAYIAGDTLPGLEAFKV